jgi:hypothetical protein
MPESRAGKLYARRRKEGLCVGCGNKSLALRCPRCRDKRRRGRAVLRATRAKEGLCPMCGRKPAAGKTWCRTCLELGNASSRASHARARK